MPMTRADCSRKRNLRNEADQLKNPTERSLPRKKRKPNEEAGSVKFS
jgi:hypothetical protein